MALRRRDVLAAAFAATTAFAARPALAGGGAVVLWPVLTPAGDDANPVALHKPKESEEKVFPRAQELDATLREAAADLGFSLDVADPGPRPGHTRDTDMIDHAARVNAHAASPGGTWVVSARLEHDGADMFLLRIVAVPPNGHELRVHAESVKGADVCVRGLVMLRDLLSPEAAVQAEAAEAERQRTNTAANLGVMSPLESPGRAVLAVNSALFGAYAAYSIQRASGSDDPRVLYPLLALGTGVGIGASLLASQEWDVSTGDAWFLSAGAWWGASAGVLIANGRHVQPLDDRYAWGIGTGLGGVALATIAMARHKMDEGDATLAHSGGAYGMLLGSLGELAYRGTTEASPYTGAGYGAGIGVVAAGASSLFVKVSPSRVMLLDLGGGLGALAGAAAASPLVFQDLSEGKTRAFLGITAGGAVVGGALAWLLTQDVPASPSAAASGHPVAGVIGASATATGSVPAYGVGWTGSF